jgi:hypothetical protein
LYSFTIFFSWWPQWFEARHLIFNWPDANANYFFAKLFANNYHLSYLEPLNTLSDNLLHSRSINVIDAKLVSVTFLPNIIIFALFYKILGALGVLFLVPLLAIISAYFFYRILKIVFDEKIALIALLLLLPFAPWLYFANLAMLSNILFISLALGAGYFWALKKYYLSVLFLSLALICRPSEFILMLVFFGFLFYWQRLELKKYLPLSLLILFIFGASFLLLNYLVYGSVFSAGYFNLQTQNLPTEFVDKNNSPIVLLKLLFAPFGFNFKLIIYNFSKYFVKIFLPYLILAILAIVYSIKRSQNKILWQRYLSMASLASLFLLIYYASWDLADPLVKNLNLISNSYVRYFLPLYIIWLPFAALAIADLFYKKYLTQLIISALAIISIYTAFWVKPDGLLEHRYYLHLYFQQFQEVKNIAPEQAIIISEREDKVFFPYYRVVVPQGDLPTWSRVEKIISQAPVYYFTNKSAEDLAKEQIYAKANNLELVSPVDISGGFKLYQVKLKN